MFENARFGETAERILDNRLYANITGRFVQSHDYIAMERLFEVHATGAYDLIVIDTPPTRNALDVHILRLRRRIAELGLEIRTVRSRGYLLQAAAASVGRTGLAS